MTATPLDPPQYNPMADTQESSAGWNCGNGGLRAQAALTLIRSLAVRDLEAMECINALIDQAGAAFARDVILSEDVPF